MCGEKLVDRTGLSQTAGSPPRVRGKATKHMKQAKMAGITPACAGKRQRGRALARLYRDHPRVCGEKPSLNLTNHYFKGSPPRVRGKALVLPTPGMPLGITPACAGKSGSLAYRPRAFMGSPPRVRGKDLRKRGPDGPCRITPACAGKRRKASLSSGRYGDHPRVCGEKLVRLVRFRLL